MRLRRARRLSQRHHAEQQRRQHCRARAEGLPAVRARLSVGTPRRNIVVGTCSWTDESLIKADAFPPDLRDRLPVLRRGAKNHYYDDVPHDVRDEMWRRFIEAVAPMHHAGKLVAVHFQFSPRVSATKAGIAHVEHCVERMQGFRVAIEFRNKSWFDEDRVEKTLAWLRDLAAVHVVVDEPQGVGNYSQGVWDLANPDLAVVRLHGRNAETWNAKGLKASSDRFNYEYSDEELTALAGRIVDLADRAFAVQVLVNVNYEDQGIDAARRLERLLGRLPAAESSGGPTAPEPASRGQTGDLFDAEAPSTAQPRRPRVDRSKPGKATEPDEDPTASLF